MQIIKLILKRILFKILSCSIVKSGRFQGYKDLQEKLRQIKSDLSDQYSSFKIEGPYLETKVYHQHAFQIQLTLDAIADLENKSKTPVVCDIGDSAGTHIIYLQNLINDIHAISVNSDPIAIKKIKDKGLTAIHSNAEDLHKHHDFSREIDIMLSFEMLEHLQDPIGFLSTMSEKAQCKRFVLTIPLVRSSRVDLYNLDHPDSQKPFNPEVTHIFELSPSDWNKIFMFSGWKIKKSVEYLQYPRYGFFRLTKILWKKFDFEGFYGVILEKDDTFKKKYQEFI